jgi:GNAT superfamily N-acetyltransferase
LFQIELKMAVRQATLQDATELARLRDLACEHIAQQRGGAVALLSDFSEQDALMASLEPGSDSERLVIIALIGDAPVGYCSAAIAQLDQGYALCRISELFVESPAQEIGMGALLLQFTREWALERQCAGIDATVMPGDRETKNFFETFGLVARAITVHQDLPGR